MTEDSSTSSAKVITELRGRFQGRILAPGDSDFERARRVWNGAVDQHPAAIAECADAEDVALAIRIASEHGLGVTVRGGGHNVAGRSVRDGALLVDLSRLRTVTVNRENRVATVQGGALWSDLDRATAEHGLATTGGMVSTTGVGGFTLGGGAGWLMRRYGLACDNLVGASVTLADGRFVRATSVENPDLFWGLRGGAGGLGAVTSFDFALYPLREVTAGLIIHPMARAAAVLRTFRDLAASAPEEYCGLAVLASAPPLPFLDSAWHGRPVIIHALCWCGEPSAAASVLAPHEQLPSPLAQHVGRMPYVEWQRLQDAGAPPGRYNYWKTANFATLDDATIETIAMAGEHLPTPQTEIHVQHMGGAVARVPAADTAFAQREAAFFVNIIGVASTSEAFPRAREGARELHAALAPRALASVLPNFVDRDDGDAVERSSGAHAERMGALRRRYDPSRLFAPG